MVLRACANPIRTATSCDDKMQISWQARCILIVSFFLASEVLGASCGQGTAVRARMLHWFFEPVCQVARMMV